MIEYSSMVRPPLAAAALTVVILTRDEAARLPRCLAAIPLAYPVLVVDSGSRDHTVDLAAAAGCVVARNPWPGFAAQRNFALSSCGLTSRWVLFIDADEIYPPAFFDWFEASARDGSDFDVALVDSRLVFKGVELRHAPGYPLYHPRLVRRGAVRFEPSPSGHGETIGRDARLIRVDIPYRHHFYDGDLAAWMHKHVELAMQEAFTTRRATAASALTPRSRLHLASRRLPLRGLARLVYHLILRGGFRDGRAGLEYALMYAWYESTMAVIRFAATPPSEPPDWRLEGK
jgi:glycosyltransferase involved in cell wall biosynthesis